MDRRAAALSPALTDRPAWLANPPRDRHFNVAPRFLVPVLNLRDEAVVRLLSPHRGAWSVEGGIATVCFVWLFVLGGYFLSFPCRMTRPNPELPIPRLRVAMIVTKAPSEPWTVVERTLRGMLDQDFPYPYDVWPATEVPTGKSIHWCRGHGVNVSTRDGVAEYHREVWPRRTKCKEGLQHMVRPFADPNVGYVAAPSICDANADKGWTVRGRLYKESTMHGPVQAGCNAGWAPVCIGSHYAVRTQALRDVGGRCRRSASSPVTRGAAAACSIGTCTSGRARSLCRCASRGCEPGACCGRAAPDCGRSTWCCSSWCAGRGPRGGSSAVCGRGGGVRRSGSR